PPGRRRLGQAQPEVRRTDLRRFPRRRSRAARRLPGGRPAGEGAAAVLRHGLDIRSQDQMWRHCDTVATVQRQSRLMRPAVQAEALARILIVDDDPGLREQTAGYLADHGYE